MFETSCQLLDLISEVSEVLFTDFGFFSDVRNFLVLSGNFTLHEPDLIVGIQTSFGVFEPGLKISFPLGKLFLLRFQLNESLLFEFPLIIFIFDCQLSEFLHFFDLVILFKEFFF